MPPIGVVLGGVNFSDLAFTLQEASEGQPAVVISYGKFIQTVVDFTIIAAAIFMLIKGLSMFKQKAEAAAPPPAPSNEELLLREIRDLLKEKK